MSDNNNNVSFGRIVYYEPNEIFGGNNKAVNQEDLTKYINLSVRIPSRYYDANSFKEYDSILNGTRFEKKMGSDEYIVFYLTDNYVNVSYNEFRGNGKFSAGELFGIDSIDISFDVQFFPQVTINFTDVKGFGLMSTMEYNYEEGKINNLTAKSFFTSLFNFPYPIFTLEVKGYYGRSVSFDLSLLEFNTAFDSQTGDFKTTVKFIGHMYGVYADIPMSFLLVSPYIDTIPVANKETLGYVWNNLSDDIEIKDIPTYLSVLRNFSDFLLEVNFNTDGYSIYQDFIKEEAKIDKLNQIYELLNTIINLANVTRDECPQNIIFGDNDVIYVSDEDVELRDILDEYSLLWDLTSEGIYIGFRPVVEKKVDNKIIYHFTDITQKRNECLRQIDTIGQSQGILRKEVNSDLLENITTKLHIIPNIKNIYKILFKHLNCFSEHFYKYIDGIEKNRTFGSLGLENYETDIPFDINRTNNSSNIVPPFPAIYETNNNEKRVLYPGDITSFSSQPEVLLTEKIFKCINYFGAEAIQGLTNINTVRNIINEVVITEAGSFFIDGLNTVNELLKHYMIINVGNHLFNQRVFQDEDRYLTDITRSTTIRDIFLSRLATYERIHYTPGRADYFAETEATLLFNSWTNMKLFDEKILNNLREMQKDGYKNVVLNRFKELSGGTYNNYYWGYINYQPNDEKNNGPDVMQLAQDGRIHYNGYTGSTIIVYASDVSRASAEIELSKNKMPDDFKITCDAYYDSSFQYREEVLKAKTRSDTGYGPGEPLNAYVAEDNSEIILNKTSYNYSGDFYNWGYRHYCPLGSYETWRFLFDKYGELAYYTDDGTVTDEENKPGQNFGAYRRDSSYNETEVIERNRIGMINKCAFHSFREYNEVDYDTYYTTGQTSGQGTAGGGGTIYTTYHTSDLCIPTNKLDGDETSTDDYKNTCISFLKIPQTFLDFIYDVPDYETRANGQYSNGYYVIGKNFQYDRAGDNKLDDANIWNIWKNFVCKVLGKYGLDCQVRGSTQQSILDKREADKKIKTDIYYTLKTLYDKWFCGLNRDYFNMSDSENGEFNKVHYLTTTFNDISNSMIVDLETFINQIGDCVISSDSSTLSVLSFMAKTAQDNNSTFLTLPTKLNVGLNENEIKETFAPHNFYDGTATHDLQGVSYIVMYNGDVSHHLADNKSDFVNDGYDIANYYGSTISPSTEAARLFAKTNVENEHDYIVPAFGVTYGMQNQNFFKNISVDTTNPSVTDYSIANTLLISQQGSMAGTNNTVPTTKSLYPIYANRSYTCNVEMMGCMNITPLMYFQLNNVPLFRGAYLITNVHHRITPNDFITTFSGVRVSKYKIPINKEAIGVTSLLRTIGLRDADRRGSTFNYDIPDTTDCQIVLNREVFYATGTVGRLYINGEFMCFTMEPTVRKRGSEGNTPADSCNHTGADNAICPGTYVIKYGHSWADTLTSDTRYRIYHAAGHANDGKIYTPRLNSSYESGGTPGRNGILIHMGNSSNGQTITTPPTGEKWSKGCIIVGYPLTNTPEEDLTNSGETTLKNLTTFGYGYEQHINDIEGWSTARAFIRVADIIKNNSNDAMITIVQNLTDSEIDEIAGLTGSNYKFKPLPPPTRNTNRQIPQECVDIYNTMVNYGNWEPLMLQKGMSLIDDTNNVNLKVELKYASSDNFAHRPMYIGLNNAYIQSEHTAKITTITNILSRNALNTKLIIYDAARPAIVQKYMVCLSGNTDEHFPTIAQPGSSYHNYGLALDISLMGPDGKPLFMGAGFDQGSGGANTSGYTSTHLGYADHINEIAPSDIGDITFTYGCLSDVITYNNITYSKYFISNIRHLTDLESEDYEYTAGYNITDMKTSLEEGGLTIENEDIIKGILRNRLLLILLARKADMKAYEGEWWHYYFGTINNRNLIHDTTTLGSLT